MPIPVACADRECRGGRPPRGRSRPPTPGCCQCTSEPTSHQRTRSRCKRRCCPSGQASAGASGRMAPAGHCRRHAGTPRTARCRPIRNRSVRTLFFEFCSSKFAIVRLSSRRVRNSKSPLQVSLVLQIRISQFVIRNVVLSVSPILRSTASPLLLVPESPCLLVPMSPSPPISVQFAIRNSKFEIPGPVHPLLTHRGSRRSAPESVSPVHRFTLATVLRY